MDAHPPVLAPPPVMDLLRSHLPLTLLVDLALGPRLRSEEVLAAEAFDTRRPPRQREGGPAAR